MTRANIEKRNKIILSIVMGIVGLLVIYPFLYIVLGSLCTIDQFVDSVLFPWPFPFEASQLKNFLLMFQVDDIWTSLFLTFGKIVFSAIMCIVTSVVGGYVFSQMRFKGKNAVFMYFMVSMMIPGIATMVPNFIILLRFPLVGGNNILGQGGFGFYNNPALHFVLGWVSAYNIFLMRQAMNGVGSSFREAASIDGANLFKIMFTIYLPLVLPIVAVMMIGLFIGVWNDYMTCLIYLPGMSKYHTIGTKIIEIIKIFNVSALNPNPNYPVIFAISIMGMLPPIIVFLIFQKQFVSGLTMGGIKG